MFYFSVDIVSFCQANPTVIRAHPSNCAQYYDCSALNFGGDYLKECPYPDLFDVGTLACRKVTEVKCGARHEPKSPCKYYYVYYTTTKQLVLVVYWNQLVYPSFVCLSLSFVLRTRLTVLLLLY